MKSIKTITSATNPEIKEVVALARDKKLRTQEKLFIAEGLRTCETLILSKVSLSTLYVTEEHQYTFKKLVPAQFVICVSESVMEKMSSATTPSGILGVFQIPQAPEPGELSGGIVLARVSDPGNMGTLIRSAAAMNVPSVVIVEGADPYSPKVVQATAGAIGRVRIFQYSWRELFVYKNKLSLCALVVSGGEKPSALDFKKSLLVVGSEAHGIPAEWASQCNTSLTLPMPGNIESLNAAVAGSIALYLGWAKTIDF